jgi:hypothetical protein
MAGEMSWKDIQPHGDWYADAQRLRFAALDLMRKTKHVIKLQKVSPFDQYQGPYAKLSFGKLWLMNEEMFSGSFFYECTSLGIEIAGSTRQIADKFNEVMAAKIARTA